MADFPKIVSVDDHVVEPPGVWQDRLPREVPGDRPADDARARKGEMTFVGGKFTLRRRATGRPDVRLVALRGPRVPAHAPLAAVGFDRDEVTVTAITIDEMRTGLLRPEGAPRGHGRELDRGAAVRSRRSRGSAARRSSRPTTRTSRCVCVKAYNDWMFDEWCGGAGGRLIPLIIVPLWDADARRRRRSAATPPAACHAVCFTEIPPFLGLP